MTGAARPPLEPAAVRFHHHPLLGTVVEVRVTDCGQDTAVRVDRGVVDEITRLERVLSIYDPASELSRWKRGEVAVPSPDLRRSLTAALGWQRRSDGAFNTSAGVVTALWRAAEASGTPPSPADLRDAAARISSPAYEVLGDGHVRPTGDLAGVDLNAFAKGWIVDRAVEVARGIAPAADLVVSAGGDLRHAGTRPVRIGIDDPLRPYDNEPPITTVALDDAALATSGRARRGFRVGGRWYAHVIDPRTGEPVDHIASISVVAPDAATADVLATIAGVMPPEEAVAAAGEHGAACMVVTPQGARLANDRWRAMEVADR